MPVNLGALRRETRPIRCEQADRQCYFIDIDISFLLNVDVIYRTKISKHSAKCAVEDL